MGKLVVTEFVSLDGVMEDPGGSEDFEHGGWSFEFQRGEEGDKFKLDETLETEALLLGRVTYEGFADAWPSRTGEFADKFNDMPKYVVSSTLKDPEWNNSTVISGDVAGAVAKLRPGPRVETAKRREPSGLRAAEAKVFGSRVSGGPSGCWVPTSQSSTVPSALAVNSVRPSGEKST